MRSKATIYNGDCLDVLRRLPDESVHCVVTSPPYWGGLRDYGVEGQLGLEPTPLEHVARMVEIAEEVMRVLHPSGVFWMNYGDCYATGAGSARVAGGDRFGKKNKLVEEGAIPQKQPNRMKQKGLKPKDLVGMPWRLALAFQDAGWWLRSDVIWNKTNAQTTSAEDRPATSHEYVFMFTKRERYYFDRDAIRELTGNESTWDEYLAAEGSMHDHADDGSAGMLQKKKPGYKVLTHPLGRARRTVWNIPTEGHDWSQYGVTKHFAAFPTALAEPLVKSGTCEKGCCPECLTPWVKTYQKVSARVDAGNRSRADAPGSTLSPSSSLRTGVIKVKRPTGWQAGCKCNAGEPIPCTVLDIFSGSGTTGLVALRNFRNYIGIELNESYAEMSRRRIESDRPLLNDVEVLK